MQERFEIRLGDALKEAWNLFMKAPEVFVALTFLYFAVFFVLGNLPVIGPLFIFLINCLLLPAFIVAADSGRGEGKISFESLQKLVPLAPQLLAVGIVKSLLMGLGFMLLVLPMFYVMAALAFAELFVVLKGRAFLDALKDSQKLAHENLLGVLGLVLFCWMLGFSGVLLAGLGVLLTAPLAVLTLYCVFKRIAGARPDGVIIPEVVTEP